MDQSTNRAEAERLLGIAEKLLQCKDLTSSREFAILAQETEPLLDGSDQILAVVDVLLAAQKRINNHHDWYAILQLERRCDDPDAIKKQYRRLALLLHPDKNKFALADSAFKLVADAWAVLSDGTKKLLFDKELGLFSKVDLVAPRNQKAPHHQFRREQEDQQQKLPVRRAEGNRRGSTSGGETKPNSFWTACPYCYNLYEFPKVYEDCCLRCQNCHRAFHAAVIPSLPPVVPGEEEYYCCWAFFPLGYMNANSEGGKKATSASEPPRSVAPNGRADGLTDVPVVNATPAPRKRGRPRKNVQA